MEYIHPPLGTATLLANLQNEGLMIMDERKAFVFLENVSYFRFAAYLRPFKAVIPCDIAGEWNLSIS